VKELILCFSSRLDLNAIGASPDKMTPLMIACNQGLLDAPAGLTGPVDAGIRNEEGVGVWDVLRDRGEGGAACRAVLARHGMFEPAHDDE